MQEHSGNIIHILIVEDDHNFSLLIGKRLAADTLLVKEANSGKEALAAIRQNMPDLMLLDLDLGDMSGYELVQKLKEENICPRFLCITSNDDRNKTVQMMQEGALDFVFKDQNFFDLLPSKVHHAIDKIEYERKLDFAKQQLETSLLEYKNLFSNSQDAIYFTNLKGRLIDFNESFERLFKYSKEELLDINVEDLYYHKSDRQDFINKIEQNGSLKEYEVKLRDKHGKQLTCLLTVTQQSKGNGFVYQGIIHDISERKKAQDELAESKQKYFSLFDNMNEGASLNTLVRDETGKVRDYLITDANPAFCSIFGFRCNAGYTVKASDFFGMDIPPFLDQYLSLFEKGASNISFEYHFENIDRYVRISAYKTRVDEFATIFTDITDNKKSEIALTQSENKFRSIVEQATDGIVLIDENGIVLDWNQSQEKITGLDLSNVLGEKLSRINIQLSNLSEDYSEADYEKEFDKVLKLYISQLKSEEEVFFEDPNIFPSFINGKYINTILFPVETKNNLLFGIITRDVTEEKILRDELLYSKKQWEKSFDAVPDLMATLTEDFCVDRLNIAMADYLDVDINRAKGICITDALEAKYGKGNVHYQLLTSISESKEYSASNIRKDNYLISTSPLYDAENKFSGFVYLARDISRIIQTEQALRNSEQRYRMLIENAFDGIYLLKDMKFQYVNKSLCSILGYSEDELRQEDFTLYDILTKESVAITEKRKQIRLAGNPIPNPYTMPIKRKDGSVFYAELSTVNYNKADKLSVLGIVRDITERKLLEDKMFNLNRELEQRVAERTSQLENAMTDLQNEIVIRKQTEDKLVQAKNEITGAFKREKELNDLKTRFIEMISHEYRTPLTVILSSTYLIERYTEDIENQDLGKSVGRIRKAVKAMTDLLENVMLVGKFQESDSNINLVDVNFADIAEQVRKDIISLDKNQHEIVFNIEDKQEFSKSDPSMLRLIMLNLLTNAQKFTPSGKRIEFSLRISQSQITIIVKDEGIGIPEDEQEKVFEPFYRAKNVGAIQGMGLGLSIVKGCVDSLGAQITLSSSTEKGTGVMVTLPKK